MYPILVETPEQRRGPAVLSDRAHNKMLYLWIFMLNDDVR